MNPNEILNKIWNPDLPIVLFDPPWTEEDENRLERLYVLEDAEIVEPHIIKSPNPALIKGGASIITRWVADLDIHFGKRAYGAAAYAGNYPIYYLGFRPRTDDQMYQLHKARYWVKNIDEVMLTEYIQLTANLIKTSY